MVNYPNSQPNLTDPLAGEILSQPSHSLLHKNTNDELEAIAAELGLNASGASATVSDRIGVMEVAINLWTLNVNTIEPSVDGRDLDFLSGNITATLLTGDDITTVGTLTAGQVDTTTLDLQGTGGITGMNAITDDILRWGNNTDTTKTLLARNGDLNLPGIRYDATSNEWQFANDGVTWQNMDAVGSANVVSPGVLTDNAVVRGDGGVTDVQTSGILIDDSDNLSGVVNLTSTGTITFNALTYTWPVAHGNSGDQLSNNGAGVLTWSAPGTAVAFTDNTFRIQDNADITAEIAFNADAITTSTVRTITMPDTDVDLADIALNTSKVTNATHTVDVTGATALTLDPVAITNKPAATVASGDLVLVADIDAANALKQVTAQSIADLGAGGGAIEVFDEGGSLTAALASLDFVGAGVVATNVGSAVTVTIAGGGGGTTLTEDVAQGAHGFSVGEVLYHNGTIYALADASASATAESIGIVSAVADAGNFTIQFGGKITGLSGLTVGEAHFLSETAGAITATAPTLAGAIVKPILIADSATTAFIFNMRGSLNTDSTSFTDSFVDADLTAGVLTVAHNLGRQYVQVQVFNDSDELILADDITLTDGNNLDIDLTSFGTLTGTYHYVIMDSGATVNIATLSYRESFVDGGLTAGVLTVTHSLGEKFVDVSIYNNSDKKIIPDDITLTDTNNLDIDLSGFGTLTGTWNLVILR